LNLSEIFIRRPIATSLLMAAIALFGIVAYRTLPVSDLPSVDFPTINVEANLPGADPATMASSVATVLERQFTTIAGIDEMTSRSQTGSSQITLQFDLDRDIDSATVDVQTAIAAATPLLPQGMPNPPRFNKNNPTDQPILQLMLSSNVVPLNQLDEFAETLMAQRISMVPGVAQVQVQGSQKFAVRVQLDPDKLVGKRIGLNEVSTALQNWNVNLPTGTLYGADKVYSIQANGQLMNAGAFRPMVVAWRRGSPVRLEEIANVVDSVENDKNVGMRYTANEAERGIQLQVRKQPGANAVEVTDRVNALMPQFVGKFPPTVHLTVRQDRSKTIREQMRDIQMTMLVTLVLVILVIFLFLRNGSATLIPSLALPIALLGTFAVMALLHYSLDTISMMALILSICFVVDDAIVMLENIVRHVENGAPPYEAALNASGEIGSTIISMTIALAAVFIPVLFMGGMLGRLFREFAVIITVAVLISGVVSITLTPMLCSRFLRVRPHGSAGWLSRAAQWPFDQLARFYGWTLAGVLRVRPLMALLFVAVLVSTFALLARVNKGFIPDSDTDFLQLNMMTPQGTSYYRVAEYQKTVAEIVRKDPNILSFNTNPGGGNWGGGMGIQLKPRKERPLSASRVIQELRPKVSQFPGFQVTLSLPPSIRIGGRNSNGAYQIEVRGPDTTQLYAEAQKLERAIAQVPEVLEVTSDLENKTPRVNVVIERERAAVYGLNANDIEQALYNAYGPSIASNIYGPANQYRVMLEMQPKYQAFTDYLSKVYFKAPAGQLVPLDSLASIRADVGPQSINHSGQLPAVTVSFNLRPGVSLGEAVDKVEAVAKDTLPANMTAHFAGAAQQFQDSLRNLALLLTIAVLVVYIVLGILYESYIQPITILSGLPSAMMGGLLTLYVFKAELNIFSFVGLIVLIGIVQKNAIMQIDFALAAERTGLTPKEAIYQGCLIRFRPIMMTTMAAFLGAIPTAMGYGSGGDARAPLGLAVAGGLLFSQLMTLYLTPVVYTYMAAVLAWRRNRPAEATVTPAPGYGD